jgi:hypothetical protein
LIDPESGALLLPSGGQLIREYQSEQIAVRVVGRPFFSERSEGWPALEIGPASLSFIRDEKGGGIVMLGDIAVQMPDSLELGEDGRSTRLLDLVFSYDRIGARALLTLDGVSHSIAARSQDGAIEIVLSAGTEAGFALEFVEVDAGSGNGSGIPDGAESESQVGLESSIPRLSRREAARQAFILFERGLDEDGEALLASVNRGDPAGASWQAQTAQALVMLAIDFSRDGRSDIADRIARLALTRTGELTDRTKAADPDIAASGFQLESFIHEKFFGDSEKAMQSARRALESRPDASVAKEQLDRLERVERDAALKGRDSQ